MKMKAICNVLAACGCPISEEGHVLSILVGLGLELEPSLAVLTSRNDGYNIRAPRALLLA